MRSLSASVLAALSGPVVPVALLLQMDFTTPVRLASAAVAIDYGGNTYYAAGTLGSVDAVVDEISGTQQLRFGLSGVASDVLALALGEDVRGVACELRLAVLDPATYAVLDAPLLFTGTLDQMPIQHGASTSTVGVVAIHRGDTYRRPKPLRYTDGDQQLLHPGDTSMRYVLSQSQAQDVWPAASYFRQ